MKNTANTGAQFLASTLSTKPKVWAYISGCFHDVLEHNDERLTDVDIYVYYYICKVDLAQYLASCEALLNI